MKRSRLVVDHDYDFDLIGIVSNAKGYKLVWEINHACQINMIKAEDLVFKFINNKNLTVTNYIYDTENSKLALIKNKVIETDDSLSSFLIPELHRFDYLLRAKSVEEKLLSSWTEKIKKLKVVHYAIPVDISKLKSKENLLF